MNIIKRTFGLLAVLFLAFAAQAQTALAPLTYQLTNATDFTLSGGAVLVKTNASTNLVSNPVMLFRGRGFNFQGQAWGYLGTNTGTITWNLELGNVTRMPSGTRVTNWVTTPTLAIAPTLNGTTAITVSTNFPLNIVDNYAMVRLKSIVLGVGGTNDAGAVYLNPTNTIISIFP